MSDRIEYTQWDDDLSFIRIDCFEICIDMDEKTATKILKLSEALDDCAEEMKGETDQGYSTYDIFDGIHLDVNMLNQPDGYEASIKFTGPMFGYWWEIENYQEIFNLSLQLKEMAKEIEESFKPAGKNE